MTVEDQIKRAADAGFTVREIRFVLGQWEAWVHKDIGESTHFDNLVRRVKVPNIRCRGETPTEAVTRAVDQMIENPETYPSGRTPTHIAKRTESADKLLEMF